ncbi:hypothetical protein, partial [Paenibacillus sp. OSY-SE]|uniref:hypothetical protein n=1 Tax=Paenibacillus sp. OSY-SE TaxID=1196323 RepID=UPI000474E8B4
IAVTQSLLSTHHHLLQKCAIPVRSNFTICHSSNAILVRNVSLSAVEVTEPYLQFHHPSHDWTKTCVEASLHTKQTIRIQNDLFSIKYGSDAMLQL